MIAKRWWLDENYLYVELEDGSTYKCDRDTIWPISIDFVGLDSTSSESVTIECNERYKKAL